MNTCESHRRVSDAWFSLHRGVYKDRLIPYLRAFQLRNNVLRNPGKEALKIILETTL